MHRIILALPTLRIFVSVSVICLGTGKCCFARLALVVKLKLFFFVESPVLAQTVLSELASIKS